MRDEKKEARLVSNIKMMGTYKRFENAEMHLPEISEYYRYLSENLTFPLLGSDLPIDFITSFESVWYILQYYLKSIDANALKSIEEILIKSNALEIFSILAVLLPNNELRRYRRKSIFSSISYSIPSLGLNVELGSDSSKSIIDSEVVLKIKASIFRITSIINNVSVNDYSDDLTVDESIKTRFNPELIDKDKLIALLSLLKSNISSLPETKDTKVLLSKMNSLITK